MNELHEIVPCHTCIFAWSYKQYYVETYLSVSCEVSNPLEELRLVLKGSKYFDGAWNREQDKVGAFFT